MTGLRCGKAFVSLYHDAYCAADWVIIGKAYGFSGLVCNYNHALPMQKQVVDSSARQWTTPHQKAGGLYRNHPVTLNGFLTSVISPADLLRVVHTLAAVKSRCLLANAVESGRELKRHFRANGIDAWGWGMMVWFDRATGEPANALTVFGRALPPLTFGSKEEWRELVMVTGEYAKKITNVTLLHALSFRKASDMDTDLFLGDWGKR